MLRIKKKRAVRWRGGYCGYFLPTESPKDSKTSAPYGDEIGSPMKNADEITEGFKTAASYGDETGSPMTNADEITEGFKMAAPSGDVS